MYTIRQIFFRQFLLTDKSQATYEEFYKKYERAARLLQIKPTHELDELIELIYNLSSEKYKDFYNEAGKINYGFLKENRDYVIKLLSVEDNRYNNAKMVSIIQEFNKTSNSVIKRNFEVVLKKYELKEPDELTLKQKLERIIDNGEFLSEITKVCQSGFEKSVKEREELNEHVNNPYLKEFYCKLLNEFEKKNLVLLKQEIYKTEALKERKFYKEANGFKTDQVFKFKKKRI